MLVARRISQDPPRQPQRHFAFLSFRWETGSDLARVIHAEFLALGMHSYFDLQHIRASRFDEKMLLEIERAANFILILGPGALDRCADPADWLRQETAHAIRTERNVVPILMQGFRFPEPHHVPSDLAELPRYNCVQHSPSYLGATLDKLLAFCSITRPPGVQP
jgi:hypothetical protein